MRIPAFIRLPALAAALCTTVIALAQAGPAVSAANPAAADASPTAKKSHDVEARIKTLHQQLKITSAEEPLWNDVTAVMRDNAQQMKGVIEQRHQAGKLSAVDDLKGYQTVAVAHTQSLDKLIPVFQKLYDSLSDEQKKTADTIFNQRRHHK